MSTNYKYSVFPSGFLDICEGGKATETAYVSLGDTKTLRMIENLDWFARYTNKLQNWYILKQQKSLHCFCVTVFGYQTSKKLFFNDTTKECCLN